MTILLKSEFIWPIQCACYIYQMQFWVTSLLHLHLLFIWHFFCVRTWYIQSYPNIWLAVWTACQTPMCFEWQNPQSNNGTKIIICFKQEESLYFKNVNFCFTKREKKPTRVILKTAEPTTPLTPISSWNWNKSYIFNINVINMMCILEITIFDHHAIARVKQSMVRVSA